MRRGRLLPGRIHIAAPNREVSIAAAAMINQRHIAGPLAVQIVFREEPNLMAMVHKGAVTLYVWGPESEWRDQLTLGLDSVGDVVRTGTRFLRAGG